MTSDENTPDLCNISTMCVSPDNSEKMAIREKGRLGIEGGGEHRYCISAHVGVNKHRIPDPGSANTVIITNRI
jgi:hypothetical protein